STVADSWTVESCCAGVVVGVGVACCDRVELSERNKIASKRTQDCLLIGPIGLSSCLWDSSRFPHPFAPLVLLSKEKNSAPPEPLGADPGHSSLKTSMPAASYNFPVSELLILLFVMGGACGRSARKAKQEAQTTQTQERGRHR